MKSPWTHVFWAVLFAFVALPIHPGSADISSRLLDSGPDSFVVYSGIGSPVRRIANIPRSIDCASASGGSFAAITPDRSAVLLLNQQGLPTTSVDFPDTAIRVVPYGEGYLVISNRGAVHEVAPDGSSRRRIPTGQINGVVPHPRGDGFFGIRSSGEVVHFSWDGAERSVFSMNSGGQKVAVRHVALQGSETLVALDAAANEIIVLNFDLTEEKRTPAPFQINDVRALYSGSHSTIGLFSNQQAVRFITSDGSVAGYQSKQDVVCAMGLPDGNFALGLRSSDPVYIPTGFLSDLDRFRPPLTFDSLFAVVMYSVVGSFAFAFFWGKIRVVLLDRNNRVVAPAVEPSEVTKPVVEMRPIGVLGFGVLFVACGGLLVSWWAYPEVRYTGSAKAWGLYWLGAMLATGALIVGGYLWRLFPGFQSLRTESFGLNRSAVSWFLLAIALTLAASVHYLMNFAGYEKLTVAAWLAGQVLLLLSFGRGLAPARWTRWECLSVLALLLITVLSRVYRWTECPSEVHYDFGAMALDAMTSLYENWWPLFRLRANQTIGQTWLMQVSASLWMFGAHDWSTRLTSLVWFTALVLGCYLLGREVISHRFGLIFGLLVVAQHNLLLFSRLPYVTESTAPFIFCLYFLCRGIQRHGLRDWALAGAWAGWSMQTVRQFTTFPFIGLGILLFFLVFHLRSLWLHRVHALVMSIGAAVAFGPFFKFFLNDRSLSDRLASTSPLYAHGRFTSDISIWINQMSYAFGGILRYPDHPAWPAERIAPLCLAITGSFFGAGLLFLLVRMRSLATPVALISMVLSIGLGSGFIEHPPSYFHQFVGIVFVMFVAAVPLDCLCELSSRLRPRWGGVAVKVALSSAFMVALYEQALPLVQFCAFKVDAHGVAYIPRPKPIVLATYILERKDTRFVMVVQPGERIEFHSAIFTYYGSFSERHEIHSPITSYVPMRPGNRPKSIEFIINEGSEHLDALRKIYPAGVEKRLGYQSGPSTLVAYSVSADEVASVYNESLKSDRFIDKKFYSLSPL